MGDYYCNLCNKTSDLKYKNRHSNTKSDIGSSRLIKKGYSVKSPELFKLQEIFEKHLDNYNKRFMFFPIRCEWVIQPKDTISRVKSKEMKILLFPSGVEKCNLKNYLSTKNKRLNRSGLEFSHISEMNSIFTTSLRNMTYNHYPDQPKSTAELSKYIYKNLNLINTVGMPVPVVRKYGNFIYDFK